MEASRPSGELLGGGNSRHRFGMDADRITHPFHRLKPRDAAQVERHAPIEHSPGNEPSLEVEFHAFGEFEEQVASPYLVGGQIGLPHPIEPILIERFEGHDGLDDGPLGAAVRLPQPTLTQLRFVLIRANDPLPERVEEVWLGGPFVGPGTAAEDHPRDIEAGERPTQRAHVQRAAPGDRRQEQERNEPKILPHPPVARRCHGSPPWVGYWDRVPGRVAPADGQPFRIHLYDPNTAGLSEDQPRAPNLVTVAGEG